MVSANDEGKRDKNTDKSISSVPRALDYQIAGIIAGGIAGELAYLTSKALSLPTFNESLTIILGAIIGFLFFGMFMRLLR